MSKNSEPPTPLGFAFEADAERLKKLFNWQEEAISFYFRRLDEYTKIPERLSKCQEPRDLYALHSDFLMKMFSDYRDEAAVISNLMFDSVRTPKFRTSRNDSGSYEATILKAQNDAEQIIRLAKQQAEQILEGAEVQAQSAKKTRKRDRKTA